MNSFSLTHPFRLHEMHMRNQIPGIQATPVRHCPNCKKTRSEAQFWNKAKRPVLKYCRLCRGLK